MQANEAAKLLQFVNWGDVRQMTPHDFEGTARTWAEVLARETFDAAMSGAKLVLRERTSEDRRPVVPGNIVEAIRRLDEPRVRAEREQRRAIENASAEAEWEAEKAFRAEHGMSRLEAAMRGEL